jgi:hypothetical protein
LVKLAERFKGVAAISHSAFVYAAMVAAVEFLGCVGLQSFPPARCLFLPSVCLVHFILLSDFDHVMRAHLPCHPSLSSRKLFLITVPPYQLTLNSHF